MKRIAFKSADGKVGIVTPLEGARLASSITFADQSVMRARSPVPVDTFLRGWPVDGAVAQWAETEDEFVARVAARSVPSDALASIVLEDSALPADREHRDAWDLVNGAIVVDTVKAIAVSRDRVDQAADVVRRKYVPQLSVVSEYQQAEEEAAAYKAAGYAGTVPASVSSWAAAKSWTARQAADDILAAAAMLRGKLMQIRAVRLGGKEAIAAGSKTLGQVLAELAAL